MKQDKGQQVRGQQLVHGEDRRSQRVMIRIGVTVHLTVQEQAVTLSTHTDSVNDHGAMLICPQSFPRGTRLILENDRTRERLSCRVTRSSRETAGGFQVPIEFEKPAPKFWGIAFPPPDWKPFES